MEEDVKEIFDVDVTKTSNINGIQGRNSTYAKREIP